MPQSPKSLASLVAESQRKAQEAAKQWDEKAAAQEFNRAKKLGPGGAVPAPVATLIPMAQTQRIIEAMRPLAEHAKASAFLRQYLYGFVAHMGWLIVQRMRAQLQGEGNLRETTSLSRGLRVGDSGAPTLTDTGGLAQVLSFRWRNERKLQLEIGPLGATQLSVAFGLRARKADEHPQAISFAETGMPTGAEPSTGGSITSGGSARTSQLTYAGLAWLHELGYAFRPTVKMVRFFTALAYAGGRYGGTAQGEGERIQLIDSPAARMLRLISRMQKDDKGKFIRVPKDIVVTVPPRPFMSTTMAESARFLQAEFPGLARQVFAGWNTSIVPLQGHGGPGRGGKRSIRFGLGRAVEGRVWRKQAPIRRLGREQELLEFRRPTVLEIAVGAKGGPLRGAEIPPKMRIGPAPSSFVSYGLGFKQRP